MVIGEWCFAVLTYFSEFHNLKKMWVFIYTNFTLLRNVIVDEIKAKK